MISLLTLTTNPSLAKMKKMIKIFGMQMKNILEESKITTEDIQSNSKIKYTKSNTNPYIYHE